MLTTSKLAEVAALVGDPARANMLTALMDGRALTATELAGTAGVTPQTASAHLARLTDAGLLAVERQGRHRYHRLASPAIAHMLEGMMTVATANDGTASAQVRTGPRDYAARFARTCYDHLAGRLAVAITDSMVRREQIELSPDGAAVTPNGLTFLRQLGVEPAVHHPTTSRQRLFCRPCLDWSERRPHVAGAVGTALLSTFFNRAWLRRTERLRTVQVTPGGRLALEDAFGLNDLLWTNSGH